MNPTLFNQKLNELFADGVDSSEVYDRLAKTLKEISDEEVAKKVLSKKAERVKALEEHKKNIATNIPSPHMSLADAASVAVMALEKSHPEWTAENISEFAEMVETTIDMLADTIGKDDSEITKTLVNNVMNKLDLAWKKAFPDVKRPSLSASWTTDESAIKKFLKDFGLD